jgi:hypothetical protein
LRCRIRTFAPLNGTTNGSIDPYHPVTGTAWVNITYVQVRWAWLAYLAVEIVLASCFLVSTVFSTHQLKLKVIKSSSMATLVALSGEARTLLGGVRANLPTSVFKFGAEHSPPVHFNGNEIVLIPPAAKAEGVNKRKGAGRVTVASVDA